MGVATATATTTTTTATATTTKATASQEHLPFAWNFWVGFLGQMEQFIKNRSKYNAVPFVKNDRVEAR